MRVVLLCAIAMGCHRGEKHADDRAGSAAIDPAEARARAAFPKGAPVGIPETAEGLVIVNHERVDLEGLGSRRARAVLVDAWGPPTVDLAFDNGRRTKGWPTPTGRCVRLDGNRVELVDCDPPDPDAPDDSQLYAAEEARVRAAFPVHAPLAVPADTHGLTVRGDGAVVLPAMPSRQLFLALEDAFGSSDVEAWAEGLRHATVWRGDHGCAVLDQCTDLESTHGRCWALLWFIPCGERDAMTNDPRWGRGP